jgi:uncharacterized protein YecE (DUF72 family)
MKTFPTRHEILCQSLLICSELRAEILHIQTPPSFYPNEKLKDIKDLLSSFDFGNIRLHGRYVGAWLMELSNLCETSE